MKHTIAVLVLALPLSLAACGKKNKIKECDDFVALAEKIEKCDKLPEATRKSLAGNAKTIKDALKTIEDFGDSVPKEQLDMVTNMCKRQGDTVREQYEKVAPDCLK